MEQIGFIGLGIMGSRMAANLIREGHQLKVYNRKSRKAAPLLEMGAISADSPSEAARDSNILITMLSTPAVVEKMALGEEGFLKAMQKNSVWVNSTTVNPSFSRRMSAMARDKGIHYIDAPVAGTKGPAEKGELVFLVGGEDEHISTVEPLFSCMGKKTIKLGPAGKGSDMKILINYLLGQSMLAFSEAITLGQQMGLEEKSLYDILLNIPVTAPFLQLVRPKMENEDYDPNFPLQWMHKDLHLTAESAYELGVPMPSLQTAKEVYALAVKQGYGEKDFSSIFQYLSRG